MDSKFFPNNDPSYTITPLNESQTRNPESPMNKASSSLDPNLSVAQGKGRFQNSAKQGTPQMKRELKEIKSLPQLINLIDPTKRLTTAPKIAHYQCLSRSPPQKAIYYPHTRFQQIKTSTKAFMDILSPSPGDYNFQPKWGNFTKRNLGQDFAFSSRFPKKKLSTYQQKGYHKGNMVTLGGALQSTHSVYPGTNFNTPGPGYYENSQKKNTINSIYGNACFLSKYDRSGAMSSPSVAPPPTYYDMQKYSDSYQKRQISLKLKGSQSSKRVKSFNLQLHATSVQDLIDRVMDIQLQKNTDQHSISSRERQVLYEDQTHKDKQAFSTLEEQMEAQRQKERKQRDFFSKLLGKGKPKRASHQRPNPRSKPNIIMSTPTSREEHHNLFSKGGQSKFQNFVQSSQPFRKQSKPLSQGLLRGSRQLLHARSRSFESNSPSSKEVKSETKRISIKGQQVHMNEQNTRGSFISPRSMAKVKVKRKGAEIFRARHHLHPHLSRVQTDDSIDFAGQSPIADTKYGEDVQMMKYLSLNGGMMDETDPKRFKFLKRGSYKKTGVQAGLP